MMLARIVLCFSLLLAFSTCNPIDIQRSEKTVNLSHMCMRVGTDGKTDNQTILLLHGLAASKYTWMGLYQVLALKTGKRVCAADLRNHGDSPWSDDADISSMASDLNPFLRTLGAEKVILLGHSLGGKVAMHYALTHPQKVDKLIVEDMRPNGVPEGAMKLISFTMNLLLSAIKSVPKNSTEKDAKLAVMKYIMDTFQKMNLTSPLNEKKVDLLPLKCLEDGCRWKMNEKVLIKILKNPAAHLTKSSGLFEKPALFIYGDASPFKVGEDEEEIQKLFPKAKLVPVKGAGHLVHDRQEFLSEVLSFILREN